MSERSALLIGVSSCDADLFEPMPDVVSADLRRMSDALRQSGYDVTLCGVEGSADGPTGNRITAAMKKAFREAAAGGVLLVYFSGHGVVVDGRSWLVPQDAYAGPDGQPDAEGLIPLVPRGVEQCRARLILLVVDACRNDLSDELTVPPRGGELPFPPDGAFVVFNSCGPGQRSRYGNDGSYFTHALADVLDRRNPARTLGEVEAAVKQRVARMVARTDGMDQRPETVRSSRDISLDLATLPICDGDQVSEAWRHAVGVSPLWERSRLSEPAASAVRVAVLEVVDACARHWLAARAQLSDRAGLTDPWSGLEYPIRVLDCLATLLPPGVELGTVELAAALTVPFLRESALSAGLKLAAGVKPTDFTRSFEDGPRSDLEITHSMHEHVWRRAEGLARRHRTEARDALAMWLVHRWLAGRASLWSDADVQGLIRQLAVTIDAGTGLTAGELGEQLCTLMQCVDADTNDRLLVVHFNRSLFDPRLRALGAMLWLSGVMAADPRRMPSVVVDHLGVSDELPIAALHRAAAETRWQRTTRGVGLYAVCEHPAIYAVLDGLVKRATLARAAVQDIDMHAGLAAGLPAEVTADGLRAVRKEGVPVFDTPVLQFRLSDEKVRELLMGRQLYGEPDLAIRELYQNALDACRYRATRRTYRERKQLRVLDWTGRITMRQGVDGSGRTYIECADNGVGMSRDTLMSTFANAGERFVYQPAYRAEHARWQSLHPPLRLVPNSQFGVGVFSYFMIAEEIVIWTRTTSEEDVPADQAVSVRISSSGSLFQINSCDEPPGGGTTVRLYLTGDDPVSVLRTMRRLLWVAEFQVEVSEDEGTTEVWQPDELRYPGAAVTPLQHGDDLWWVSGEGGLAADGIRTNEERYGLVVNLRGQHRPQFTVDRNRLRHWDRGWVEAQVRGSLAALANWQGLTLNWLWKVTEKTPAVAETVFDWLAEHDRDLPLEGSWAHGQTPPARRVGCLPVDQELFTGGLRGYSDATDQWLLAWRVGVWSGVVRFPGTEKVPAATRLEGFPIARPRDAAVVDRVYEAGNHYLSSSRYGRPSVDDLLSLAADEEESPAARLHRLRRYAITGLDLTAGRQIPPVHHRFHDDERPPAEGLEDAGLLCATAAWAPPGDPPRQAIGGWLAKASNVLNAPLREVLRRTAAVVPSTWTAPNTRDLGDLLDHVFTGTDLEVFARRNYRFPPWIGPVVQPAQVAGISGKLGKSVPDVLRMFERFAALGYTVAGRDQYPPDLQPVEHSALLFVDEIGRQLTPLHLFILAGRSSLTVSEVRERLTRLSEAGFIQLPSRDPLPDVSPSEEERAIINDELMVMNYRDMETRPATAWTVIRLLTQHIGAPQFNGFKDRLDARRRLLRIVTLDRPVMLPEIIDIAYLLDITVAEAVAHFSVLFGDEADFSALPPGAQTSDAVCHRNEEYVALVDGWNRLNYGEDRVRWALRPGHIARGAAMARQSIPAFLERLEDFRCLGAAVPALADDVLGQLADRPVDRYDVAMLSEADGAGQEHIVDVVSPLWLVQVSGRFGWTPAETRARMARFEPLGLVVECPATACPEQIVAWQDLLVLTTCLDGQYPPLCGVVGEDHVVAAAAEIDETTDQVRRRLAPYAELFGFTLATEPFMMEVPDDGSA